MSKFVLTAQLQLQAPGNTRQVINQLRSQLQGQLNIPVSVTGSVQATKQIKQVAQQTQQATTAANNMGKAFGASIKRFAAFNIATRAVGLLASKLSQAVDEAIEFQRQLVKISQVTGKTIGQLKGLTDEITRLSTTLGVSSTALLGTTRILAQAGIQAGDLKVALEALAKTTLAPTFDNITETAEGAVAILAQFGQGVGALEQQLGAINAVAGQFAVESGDLISSVRRMGGVFVQAGGDLNELLALFTSVRATTRENAESISTGLRTIFTRIQRPQTIEYLKQFGVELTDLNGKFIGPYEAVRELSKALAGLDRGDIRFVEIAEQLGGFRQIGKVIPLLQQFEVAERARQAAIEGGNSLSEDAVTAQQALAVQIEKTREKFVALIRSISETSTFRIMIQSLLGIAEAFIKVADAIKPIIPLIAAFAAVKLTRGLGSFVSGLGAGVRGKNQGGKIHAFASGGSVPGTGNRDTVPAMLTPGEFVIRKSSVNKIGAGTLAAMNENKYAKGGIITKPNEIGMFVLNPPKGEEAVGFMNSGLKAQITNPAALAKLNKGAAKSGGSQQLLHSQLLLNATGATQKGILGNNYSHITKREKVKQSNFNKTDGKPKGTDLQLAMADPGVQKRLNEFQKTGAGGKAAALNPTPVPISGPVSTFFTAGRDLKKSSGISKAVTNATKEGMEQAIKSAVNQATAILQGIQPIDANEQKVFSRSLSNLWSKGGGAIESIEGFIFEGLIGGLTGSSIAGGGSFFDFHNFAGIQRERLAGLFGAPEIAKLQKADAKRSFSPGLLGMGKGTIPMKIANDINAGDFRGVMFAAKGGAATGSDTVPAMLTPGEFVVNKKASQSIGYGNLNKMNKQGVVGFAKGGPVEVQNFANGGFIPGSGGGSPSPSINVSFIQKGLNKVAVGLKLFSTAVGQSIGVLKNIGVVASKPAEILGILGDQAGRVNQELIKLKASVVNLSSLSTVGEGAKIAGESLSLISRIDTSLLQKGLTKSGTRLSMFSTEMGHSIGFFKNLNGAFRSLLKGVGTFRASVEKPITTKKVKGAGSASKKLQTLATSASEAGIALNSFITALKNGTVASTTSAVADLNEAAASDKAKVADLGEAKASMGAGLGMKLMAATMLTGLLPAVDENSSAIHRAASSMLGMVSQLAMVVFALEAFGISLNKASLMNFFSGGGPGGAVGGALGKLGKAGGIGVKGGLGLNAAGKATRKAGTNAVRSSVNRSVFGAGESLINKGAARSGQGLIGRTVGKGQELVGRGLMRSTGAASARRLSGGTAIKAGQVGVGRIAGSTAAASIGGVAAAGSAASLGALGPMIAGFIIDGIVDNAGKLTRATEKGDVEAAGAIAEDQFNQKGVDTIATGVAAVASAIPVVGPAIGAVVGASIKLAGQIPIVGEFLGEIGGAINTFFGGENKQAMVARAKVEAGLVKIQKEFGENAQAAAMALEDVEAGSKTLNEVLDSVAVNANIDNAANVVSNAKQFKEGKEAQRPGVLRSIADWTPVIGWFVKSTEEVNAEIDKSIEQMDKKSADAAKQAFDSMQPIYKKLATQVSVAGGSFEDFRKALPKNQREFLEGTASEIKDPDDPEGKKFLTLMEVQRRTVESQIKAVQENIKYLNALNFGLVAVNSKAVAVSASLDRLVASQETGYNGFDQAASVLEESLTTAAANMDPADLEAAQKTLGDTLRSFGANPKQVKDATDSVKGLAAAQSFAGKALETAGKKLAASGGDASADSIKKEFTDQISAELDRQKIGDGAKNRILESLGKVDFGSEEVQTQLGSGNYQAVLDQAFGPLSEEIKKQVLPALQERAKQEKVLIDLTKQRIQLEQAAAEAQKKALDINLEAAQAIADFGGRAVTTGDKVNVLNKKLDIDLAAAGVRGVGGGTAQDLAAVQQNILANFNAQENAQQTAQAKRAKGVGGPDGAFGGVEGVEEDKRPQLKAAQDALIDFSRQRIALIKEELDIIRKKNALEKSSLEKLLGGDIEGFFKDQAAVGAASALRTGNEALLGSFGATAIGAGFTNLQDQNLPAQDMARISQSALGALGIQDTRSAQILGGATAEEQRLQREGQQFAGVLGVAGQTAAEMAEMEVKTKQITINGAVTIMNQGAGANLPPGAQGPPAPNPTNVRSRFAKGGMVYASRGMFVPRGTDTVPAMLTPGEFVVNRAAVNTGNNLAALQAMNGSGGSASAMSRGGTVYAESGGFMDQMSGGFRDATRTMFDWTPIVGLFVDSVEERKEYIKEQKKMLQNFKGSNGLGVGGKHIDPMAVIKGGQQEGATDVGISSETLTKLTNVFSGFSTAVDKLSKMNIGVKLDPTEVNVNFNNTTFLASLKDTIKSEVLGLVRNEIEGIQVSVAGNARPSNGSVIG